MCWIAVYIDPEVWTLTASSGGLTQFPQFPTENWVTDDLHNTTSALCLRGELLCPPALMICCRYYFTLTPWKLASVPGVVLGIHNPKNSLLVLLWKNTHYIWRRKEQKKNKEKLLFTIFTKYIICLSKSFCLQFFPDIFRNSKPKRLDAFCFAISSPRRCISANKIIVTTIVFSPSQVGTKIVKGQQLTSIV